MYVMNQFVYKRHSEENKFVAEKQLRQSFLEDVIKTLVKVLSLI